MNLRSPKILTGFACLVVASLNACQQRPATNLVVICIDTVRQDSFLSVGLPDSFDRWIDRAQVYENATAAGPWTMPSVASVLTGLYPIEHGAGRFPNAIANLATDPPSPLSEDNLTLTEHLQEAGFRTGAFVSHPFFRSGLGLDQGFEIVAPRKGWQQDLERFLEWRQGMEPDERFFAYLHFMEAHDWHLGSRRILQQRIAELSPEVRRDTLARANSAICEDSEDVRCLRQRVYNAAVAELRQAVATVLEELESSGLLDSTLVMLYSDHGEEFWEHESEQRRSAEDPRGIYGFGHGQSMYQELLHVPILVWLPKRRGARHPELVSLVDMMPSALEWLGMESGGLGSSGKVLPLSPEPVRPSPSGRAVYSSGIAYGPEKVAARLDRLKTVFEPKSHRFQYFDLADDPGERKPKPERNDLVMTFDTLVGDYMEMARTDTATSVQLNSQQIRQLKAIGYLQGFEEDVPTRENEAPNPEPGVENGAKENPP